MHFALHIRALALPACLFWGLVEFVALQRARRRLSRRRF
jgi:hypothetical protein